MRFSSIRNVCAETVRQKFSVTVIYSVLLTVIMPVLILLTKTASNGSEKDFMTSVMSLLVLYSFVVMTFTFISSVTAFSYMHKKRSVDFYGSMPVLRREEFFGRGLAVWLIMSVPMLVIAVLGGLTAWNVNVFFLILYFSLRLLVTIAASVVFTGFLAVCSGTVASTVISYILINLIYPIFMLIVLGMPEMLPGFVSEFKNAIVLSAFSPFLAPYFMIDASPAQLIVILTVIILVSGGLGFASYHLVNNRKAECAQSKPAFSAPSVSIRFMTSFTCGYIGAFVFYAMFRINYFIFGGMTDEEDKITSLTALMIFILGFIAFSFLAHFILFLIYKRGLKDFVKGLFLYGAQLAFCLIMLGVIVTGAFGYVSRVPDLRDINYITVETNADSTVFSYNDENLGLLKITDRNEIKQIRQLHEEVAEKEMEENNYVYMSLFSAMFEDFYNNCKIKYYLKDGSTLVRQYNTDHFGSLFDNYKNIINRNIVSKADIKNFESVRINLDSSYYYIVQDDGSDLNDIVEAFRADLKNNAVYDNNKSIGDTDYSIEFTIKVTNVRNIYMNIDSGYTNTLNLLNSERYLKYREDSYALD